MKISAYIKRPHWLYLFSLAALLVFGSIAVYSATQSLGGANSYFNQHILFIVIGIIVFTAISVANGDLIKSLSWVVYGLGILLLLVLFVQSKIHPSDTPLRWIFIGKLSIQPSEFMKIGLILGLARVLSESKSKNFVLFLKVMSLTLIPVGLIMLQPDLGTAVSLLAISLILVFFSRVGVGYVLGFIASGIGILIAFKDKLFHEYQWNRITSFLHPEKDPTGESWSVRQALIAIGSGGLRGKGYMKGTQSKMGFLPDTQYSDFIFAVIGEEFGFFGCILLISLFGLLLFSSIHIASETKDTFQKFAALGIVSLWTIQIIINIGMNLSLLPVTGLPLPFVSYGGSALLTNMLAAGIIYHVHIHKGQIHYI